MILAAFCLMVTIAFVAFAVDLGLISLTRSQMQSASDAAALAAVMEITHAVETAPAEEADIVAYAKDEAAAKAAEVAQLNGFYVDPSTDVVFGSRTFDEGSGEYSVDWSIGSSDPANVIKVTIRKDDPDVTQPDGQLRLLFAGVLGSQSAALQADATAFVEARDMVVVHDFSRSMNFDSHFSDETAYTPSDATVVGNMQALWDDLQPLNLGTMGFTPQYMTLANANPEVIVAFMYSQAQVSTAATLKEVKLQFTNGNQQAFTASGSNGTYSGTGGNSGRNISSVWVTVTVDEGNGPQPASVNQSSPTRSTEFSGDRESVTIDSNSSWSRVELEFEDGSTQTIYDSGNFETYSGTGGSSGKKIASARIRVSGNWKSRANAPSVTYGPITSDETFRFDDTDNNVKAAFGLNNVPYPYPSGSWDSYISFVRNNTKLAEKGYAETYGGLTFVDYILHEKSSHSETPALATSRHYPFHAIKRGHLLLCDFLEDLGFNDYLGMVSYDSYHRIEEYQNDPSAPLVDIRSDRLGTNYSDIANLMRYKQANHYYPATNIGGGMRDAIALLDAEKRAGARPNIILMTDGNANTTDGSTSLPGGWETWFNDYDGPGTTYNVNHDNPSSSVRTARYSLIHEVHDAVNKGYTIHTIAVGSDADWRTMKAVAHYGKGQFLYVPGGTSTEEMEANLMSAFHRIAGLVPPAKLLND
ncbi:MAG: hypothetical protein KDA75_03805 [Planctomycetaceae bacterium]|nr:hypothetical protein [Planctomycetaceae bacterium]